MGETRVLAEIEAGPARLGIALRARTRAEMEEQVNGDWRHSEVVRS